MSMNDKCVAIAGWQGGVVTMGHMFPGIWIPAAGWHGISAWRLLFSTAKFSTSSLVAYWSKSCVIWTQSAGGGQYEIGFIQLWLKIVLEGYSYFIFGILIQVVWYLDSICGRWSVWDPYSSNWKLSWNDLYHWYSYFILFMFTIILVSISFFSWMFLYHICIQHTYYPTGFISDFRASYSLLHNSLVFNAYAGGG